MKGVTLKGSLLPTHTKQTIIIIIIIIIRIIIIRISTNIAFICQFPFFP